METTTREENVYSPPVADLREPAQPVTADAEKAEFYPVSSRKFLVLYISTMGMYSLVWFYQNWRRQSRFMTERIRPAWRAIFQIFFTHKLFQRAGRRAREKGIRVKWTPNFLATLYVVLSIIDSGIARVTSSSTTFGMADVAGILLIPALMYPLFTVQKTLNEINRDPRGRMNDRFTPVNWFWIVVGMMLWGLIALGFAEPYMGEILKFMQAYQ